MIKKDLADFLFGTINSETLAKFKQYHLDRPDIYDSFASFTLQMYNTGRDKYSAKAIMERIRWEHDIKATDGEFKISNSMTSLYVRMFIYRNPDFLDFFRLKKVRGLRNPETAHINDNEYIN